MPKKEGKPPKQKKQIFFTSQLRDGEGTPAGVMLLKARGLAQSKNYGIEERKMFAKIADRILIMIKTEMPIHLRKYLRSKGLPVYKTVIRETLAHLYFDKDGNPAWGAYETAYLKNLRLHNERIEANKSKTPLKTTLAAKPKKKNKGKTEEKSVHLKIKKKETEAPLTSVSAFTQALKRISAQNPPGTVSLLNGLLNQKRIEHRHILNFARKGPYTLRIFNIALDARLDRFGETATADLADILLRIGSDGAHKTKVKSLAGSLKYGNKILKGLLSTGLVLDHRRDLYLAQPEFLVNAIKKIYKDKR
ncbi:hypothetical protein KKH30_00870 [Candidatus Micrarchaeota archaeon]|nr:hypothetical protein [Candidatus Micrarchaeota archaeon]